MSSPAHTHNAQDAGLLRLMTAGSVDDGKSTLIGRLLYDAKAILNDQLSALESARNKRVAEGEIDFSFLTDGLESEREQGITIDVAYRYFSTPRRKFIIADCPGHEQYTRNMVTGASTVDAVVILIDATRVQNGELLMQTRRHTAIALMLGIRHILVAVNKMDLVGYDQARFEEIRQAYLALLQGLNAPAEQSLHFLPLSALKGDNVVGSSEQMPWFQGQPLLPLLESLPTQKTETGRLRFPVQLVMRWGGHTAQDHRAYAGRVESGQVKVGDALRVFPSGAEAQVAQIVFNGEALDIAHAGESVMVYLDRDVDVSRGDVLVSADQLPSAIGGQALQADLAWLDDQAQMPGRRYILRQGTRETQAKIDLVDRLNLKTLGRDPAAEGAQGPVLAMNEIGRASIKTAAPVLLDAFDQLPATGAFVLIDDATNQTAAAGMIRLSPSAG